MYLQDGGIVRDLKVPLRKELGVLPDRPVDADRVHENERELVRQETREGLPGNRRLLRSEMHAIEDDRDDEVDTYELDH
jgi:hypothetical protein